MNINVSRNEARRGCGKLRIPLGVFVILLTVASITWGQMPGGRAKPIWPIDQAMLDKQFVDGWDRDAYIMDGSGERLILSGTYIFIMQDMNGGGWVAVFSTLDWDYRVFNKGEIYVDFHYDPDFIQGQWVLLWLEHVGTLEDLFGDKMPRFRARAYKANGLYYGPQAR